MITSPKISVLSVDNSGSSSSSSGSTGDACNDKTNTRFSDNNNDIKVQTDSKVLNNEFEDILEKSRKVSEILQSKYWEYSQNSQQLFVEFADNFGKYLLQFVQLVKQINQYLNDNQHILLLQENIVQTSSSSTDNNMITYLEELCIVNDIPVPDNSNNSSNNEDSIVDRIKHRISHIISSNLRLTGDTNQLRERLAADEDYIMELIELIGDIEVELELLGRDERSIERVVDKFSQRYDCLYNYRLPEYSQYFEALKNSVVQSYRNQLKWCHQLNTSSSSSKITTSAAVNDIVGLSLNKDGILSSNDDQLIPDVFSEDTGGSGRQHVMMTSDDIAISHNQPNSPLVRKERDVQLDANDYDDKVMDSPTTDGGGGDHHFDIETLNYILMANPFSLKSHLEVVEEVEEEEEEEEEEGVVEEELEIEDKMADYSNANDSVDNDYDYDDNDDDEVFEDNPNNNNNNDIQLKTAENICINNTTNIIDDNNDDINLYAIVEQLLNDIIDKIVADITTSDIHDSDGHRLVDNTTDSHNHDCIDDKQSLSQSSSATTVSDRHHHRHSRSISDDDNDNDNTKQQQQSPIDSDFVSSEDNIIIINSQPTSPVMIMSGKQSTIGGQQSDAIIIQDSQQPTQQLYQQTIDNTIDNNNIITGTDTTTSTTTTNSFKEQYLNDELRAWRELVEQQRGLMEKIRSELDIQQSANRDKDKTIALLRQSLSNSVDISDNNNNNNMNNSREYSQKNLSKISGNNNEDDIDSCATDMDLSLLSSSSSTTTTISDMNLDNLFNNDHGQLSHKLDSQNSLATIETINDDDDDLVIIIVN
ncbi:protein CLEC16A homolog [Oppia nitens]|uniref:protein CLEC16A homolog n=1 Tax=Oppia nitens TaxID=1686743 RepID=UPI0023D9A3D8|nr:protein CLEC16A homolog [Oppia nitens]